MSGPQKNGQPRPKRSPARSLETRENQLIALAVDLAARQLSDGSASSQVITHFLKLGTTRELLEKEKLRKENLLLQAKTDSIKSAEDTAILYRNALNAMRSYGGLKDETGEDSYDSQDEA